MGLLDRLRRRPPEMVLRAPAAKRGRLGIDAQIGGDLPLERTYAHGWKLRQRPDTLSTLKAVRDLHPDASMAVLNFVRLANQGHEVYVWRKGRPGQLHTRGQAYVNELAARIAKPWGQGTDALCNLMFLTLVSEGAIGLEVEIAPNRRDVVDFHPIDPALIQYRRRADGTYELGYNSQQGFVSLEVPNFFYTPLDPVVDDPYGRSLILSALTTIFYQARILEDLEAVAHFQGHPRLDLEVVQEVLLANAPASLKAPGREGDLQRWVEEYMMTLQDTIRNMRADDAFIHLDSVKVQGVSAGEPALDYNMLRDAIDSQIITGTKQLPILLGRNDGSTTTHATVQQRIYRAHVEAIQRVVKRTLEKAYSLALQLQGIQATVEVHFDDPVPLDEHTQIQIKLMQADFWQRMVDLGYASREEAAMALVGHAPVSEQQATPQGLPTPPSQNSDEVV